MFSQVGLMAGKLLNNPNARAIFILTTLALAALVGGAPSDLSGG